MSPMTTNIPSHVTCLYVFTVINLALLLNITVTDATILVLNDMNDTIGEITREQEAQFGPRIPAEGVWGHLSVTSPPHACSVVKPPPSTSKSWIALIRRRECDFDLKVYNAQKAGYIAAIVYNNDSDDLVPMGAGKKAEFINIPSAFIGFQDGEYLRYFNNKTDYSILLDDQPPFNVQLYLIPFAIVVGICFILMLVFMIVKWVRDIRRRRRSRLSTDALKKIPVKKFKKGDDYDVCAICLDEYEEGDKLRILPCSHAYHQKCIDPWLTKNKKTCPICKRKVIPGREGNSSDSSDSDDSGADNETTPLVPAQDLRRNPLLSAGSHGTFDNSGLPETVRNQLAEIPETSSDSEDSSHDGGGAPSSFYQSSVEIHSDIATTPQPHIDHSSRGGGAQQVTTGAPLASYAIMDETEDTTASDGAPSEGQDAVEVLGGYDNDDDDDDAAVLGAVGGHSNQGLDMSEDHFPPEAMDPLGVVQAAGPGPQEADDKKNGQNEEEVEVMAGRRNKRKKKHSKRRRNENA